MKLPRSLSGAALVKALSKVGYEVIRQTGSHIRLTNPTSHPHHITVPKHDSLRVGTLSSILADVATHLDISKEELTEKLF